MFIHDMCAGAAVHVILLFKQFQHDCDLFMRSRTQACIMKVQGCNLEMQECNLKTTKQNMHNVLQGQA